MSTQTEFKNDNLKVKIERAPGAIVKFDISIMPQATKAAYAKAVKNINKEITVPGFRKGKAPEAMVLQHYGKHVDQEWNTILLNTAFKEAMKLTNIYPLSDDSIQKPQIKKLSREEGAEIYVEFEALPEVPEIKPEDIHITPSDPTPIKDQDIEDRIYDLRVNLAEWVDITDRPIQEGDYADLDIDSLDNPGLNICKDQRFLVADGKIGNWLYKLLIGKNINDTVEGTSEKEPCPSCEDHSHEHPEEPEFKPTHCRITIKAIKNAILPELTDELAQKMGAENLTQMRERVEQTLKNEAAEIAQDKLRKHVEDQLLEKCTFDVPVSLMNNQYKRIVANRIAHLQEAHEAPEAIEAKRKEIAAQVLKEILDSTRLFLICEKLARDLKIKVSADEIMQEYMVQLYMTRPEDSFISQGMEAKEIRSRIHAHLVHKKVKDYLIQHAKKD